MSLLYTRYQHGVRPVKLTPNGWEIQVDGSVKHFTDPKALMQEITGNSKIPVNRYFPQTKLTDPTEKVFKETFNLRNVTLGRMDPLAPPVGSPLWRKPTRAVGVDLATQYMDVRRLFYAGFARSLAAKGYDPEDVLQEVCQGLLTRNVGKCPWDPAKSSLGHYVHMVTNCIVSNYIRKHKRPLEHLGESDVGSSGTTEGEESLEHGIHLLEEVAEDFSVDLKSKQARVLRLMIEGYGRQEISDMLGISPSQVSREISAIRSLASARI